MWAGEEDRRRSSRPRGLTQVSDTGALEETMIEALM